MTVVAKLVIQRPPASWSDRLRAYRVVVDGVVKGELRNGQELAIAVPPGRHWAQARIDWTGSPRLDFEAGPGAEVRLPVEPRANPLTVLWYLFGRDRWLRLTRVS